MWNWWNGIISGEVPLEVNSSIGLLIERSIQDRQGKLSSNGSLVISTGKFTGRATLDKYVVTDDFSKDVIDWGQGSLKLDYSVFYQIKEEVLKKINILKVHTYIMERSVGADNKYSLGVRFISTSAPHALFCRNIFRDPLSEHSLGNYTIYHSCELDFPWEALGLRSSTVIAISFETKEILIVGTGYAGEIKKSIFTVMNTILPDLDVLPLHAGGNVDQEGRVSLFLGLSGTGKTTLSTDEGYSLIGDDEIGLSTTGVFNFEGGCYAKTFGLTEKTEPQIFQVANQFGTLLENVTLHKETRAPIFSDKTLTENGRASYPLSALSTFAASGTAKLPSNIFFLSADALGALPAISKLDSKQAMYYFMLGYTAKLAGTELGLNDIRATFSHCFGAPFMIRHPLEYCALLKKILDDYGINVWLINTGWYGGTYGVGERYPLSFTRSCIRSIQNGAGKSSHYKRDPIFNLMIPDSLTGVDSQFLQPSSLWKDKNEYISVATDLKTKFQENFERFSNKETDSHLQSDF